MIKPIVVLLSISEFSFAQNCKPSKTTASGWAAPKKICSGQLIFHENFDKLDKNKWKPEVTLGGGGNNEFEWYTASNENSFIKDGKLHIKPTLTADKIRIYAIEHSKVRLKGCTDEKVNCERQAGGNKIINPIRSARLNTLNSFTFKYGRVEIIAKLPNGDWLWPALWLLPAEDKYHGWAGEIDIMESRGNAEYVTQVETTLHFGQLFNSNHKSKGFVKIDQRGFDQAFHKYGLIWDESGIKFLIDGEVVGSVPIQNGYWKQTGLSGRNPWANGAATAPFDQRYYILINLAVGGTSGFFPDNDGNNKPWSNKSPTTAAKDFWTRRQQWLPSWANREKSSFIVDSVKVWAI